MATESPDPRIGFIVKIGVLAIGTLIFTHLVLVAYFDDMVRGEEYRKIGSVRPDALMSLRSDEKDRLTQGRMPIDRAMQQLATRGRTGASPDIDPSASRDVSPLQGWTKLPVEVPPPMLSASAPPPPPSAAPSSSTTPAPVSPPASSGKPHQP